MSISAPAQIKPTGMHARQVREFNTNFSTAVQDMRNLRVGFLETRFDYLKQYCVEETKESYSRQNLARVLTSGQFKTPGTDVNPWANFAGRNSRYAESDYIKVLFLNDQPGVTPKESFVYEFNKHLVKEHVPVKLKYERGIMFWILDI